MPAGLRERRDLAISLELRRAASVVITFEAAGPSVHNFLTRNCFSCNVACVELLNRLDDWRQATEIFTWYSDVSAESVADQLTLLLRQNAIVAKGTAAADADEVYRTDWPWGTAAGFFHFSIRDPKFLPPQAQREWLRRRRAMRPSPRLLQSNEGVAGAIPLPDIGLDEPLFQTMYRRRSRRTFADAPISQQALADCLFCAKGVTGHASDPDFGTLPKTMTPSGGARNPYELYVYVARVEGLQPGIYHYAGLDHDLALTGARTAPLVPMLGGQDWCSDAAAVIFLVAQFARSAWKYHLAPAYRVVLIESGCIAQNVMLAATHHGLSAVPTAALNESLIERLLGVQAIDQAAVLAMVIGQPVPGQEERQE